MGGGELKWRLRGGIELVGVAGERRRRSGVWERGMSERARGLGCGGPLDAGARKRWGSRALRRPSHGGGEVASTGRFWAAWRACTRPAEQLGWRRGTSRRRVEASATQEGARGRPRAAGGAATRRRQQKQRRRLEVEDRDLNVISRILGT